jgi:hypothetical protein
MLSIEARFYEPTELALTFDFVIKKKINIETIFLKGRTTFLSLKTSMFI